MPRCEVAGSPTPIVRWTGPGGEDLVGIIIITIIISSNTIIIVIILIIIIIIFFIMKLQNLS